MKHYKSIFEKKKRLTEDSPIKIIDTSYKEIDKIAHVLNKIKNNFNPEEKRELIKIIDSLVHVNNDLDSFLEKIRSKLQKDYY